MPKNERRIKFTARYINRFLKKMTLYLTFVIYFVKWLNHYQLKFSLCHFSSARVWHKPKAYLDTFNSVPVFEKYFWGQLRARKGRNNMMWLSQDETTACKSLDLTIDSNFKEKRKMSRAQSATSSRTTGRGGRSATVVPIKRGQRQPKVPEVSHPCAACTRENVSVEATSYCKDCEENLCANCIKQHSKFASMKTHVIMSGPQTNSGDKGPQTTPFSCPYHPEKTVDMYCVKHDEVLCGACIAVNHK